MTGRETLGERERERASPAGRTAGTHGLVRQLDWQQPVTELDGIVICQHCHCLQAQSCDHLEHESSVAEQHTIPICKMARHSQSPCANELPFNAVKRM